MDRKIKNLYGPCPKFFASGFLLLALCSVLFVSFCYSATPQEEYKRIQKQIHEHKKKLEKAKRREHSILSELEMTNKQLNDVEAELRKYRKTLSNTELRIAKVESDISINRDDIERRKEWIRRKLRATYKYGQTPETVMLYLTSDDLSQMMRRGKSLQYITVYEHRVLNTYKANLEVLQEKENQLVKLKRDLIRNRENVRVEEVSLAEKKKDKEILLASVKNEEYSYKKMLSELKDASKRLLEVIRETEKTDTFSAEGLSKLKGKLPWPVQGKVAIPYGSQRDPQFNTPIFRSGTYIQSIGDSAAKAVYNGKVVFAEWFKGYGQLVIVNHGNGYHTLYGSLSEIFTKVGDIIKVNQAIGRVGNSGILNAPGLYFEIRYKGKPLDPFQWLKKR